MVPGSDTPTADGRTLARAALISCCTISHTELSEGAELAEAGGCVENDAVEGSICGGRSWPGNTIPEGVDRAERDNRTITSFAARID